MPRERAARILPFPIPFVCAGVMKFNSYKVRFNLCLSIQWIEQNVWISSNRQHHHHHRCRCRQCCWTATFTSGGASRANTCRDVLTDVGVLLTRRQQQQQPLTHKWLSCGIRIADALTLNSSWLVNFAFLSPSPQHNTLRPPCPIMSPVIFLRNCWLAVGLFARCSFVDLSVAICRRQALFRNCSLQSDGCQRSVGEIQLCNNCY